MFEGFVTHRALSHLTCYYLLSPRCVSLYLAGGPYTVTILSIQALQVSKPLQLWYAHREGDDG